MRKIVKLGAGLLGFLLACMMTILLVTVRYLFKTPQAFESILPGEARLYKWRHGYVYYKVSGVPDAPALVLFHAPGVGASGYEMRYLAKELAHDYQVYTLDLLGFGLSDRPCIEYTAELYVSLYRDFLREVVQRPAILLGSGLSANYCVAVAESTPALCQQLILLAPETIVAMPHRPAWLAMLAANQFIGFVLYALVTSRPLLRIIVKRDHNLDAHQAARAESEELQHRFCAAHQFRAQHVILALLAGKLDLEVVHRLPRLTQPVQMIWGEQVASAFPPLPSMTARIYWDTISGSSFFPHEEQPEKVIASIRTRAAALQCVPQPALLTPAGEPPSAATQRATTRVEQVEDCEKQELTSAEVEMVAPATNSTTDAEEPAAAEGAAQKGVMAYCFKCKQKRTIQDVRRVTTPRGRRAVEGTCPVCATRLFRFVAS